MTLIESRRKQGPLVLVTDGGSGQARSTLATVRALGSAGYRPLVIVSGLPSIAAASRYCARAIVASPVQEPESFRAAVQGELDAGDFVAVLAASDAALLALGFPVKHLIDKSCLLESAKRVGIPSPPTEFYETSPDLAAAARSLPYPVVIKSPVPGARVRRLDSLRDLNGLEGESGPYLVQPYITAKLRSIAGVVWEGKLVAAIHQRYLRIWPTDCGGACAAETIEPDLDLEEPLTSLLAGFQGVFHAQFAGGRLLDVNPRVYGSLPLAVVAGTNLPAIYCDLLRGLPAPDSPIRARPGVFYRWLEGDLRHVLARLTRREVSPGAAIRLLLPRTGSAHGPESIVDPKPMLQRFRYAARSYIRRNRPTTSVTP